MADSRLVVYEDYTDNCGPGRAGNEIEYIVVHHMAVNGVVEGCGKWFHEQKYSAHYAVGVDGRIAQYVREKDTAWSLHVEDINQKSINIELANCSAEPDWKVSDEVIEKCIDLITDICRRLGWDCLSYTGDMRGRLIKHCYVHTTECPGPYLGSKFEYIADCVNERLKMQEKK